MDLRKTMLLYFLVSAIATKSAYCQNQNPPQIPSTPRSCGATQANLAPCFNYLSTGNTAGVSACCRTLAVLASSSQGCLCQIFNSNSPLGFPIDQSRVLILPGLCNINTPSPPQCQGVGGSSGGGNGVLSPPPVTGLTPNTGGGGGGTGVLSPPPVTGLTPNTGGGGGGGPGVLSPPPVTGLTPNTGLAPPTGNNAPGNDNNNGNTPGAGINIPASNGVPVGNSPNGNLPSSSGSGMSNGAFRASYISGFGRLCWVVLVGVLSVV